MLHSAARTGAKSILCAIPVTQHSAVARVTVHPHTYVNLVQVAAKRHSLVQNALLAGSQRQAPQTLQATYAVAEVRQALQPLVRNTVAAALQCITTVLALWLQHSSEAAKLDAATLAADRGDAAVLLRLALPAVQRCGGCGAAGTALQACSRCHAAWFCDRYAFNLNKQCLCCAILRFPSAQIVNVDTLHCHLEEGNSSSRTPCCTPTNNHSALCWQRR